MAMRAIISITINPELLKRLDDLADAQGVPRSQLVESLIEQGITEEEIGVKAFTNPVIMSALTKSFLDPAVLRAMTSTISAELSPEQLELFRHAMESVHSTASKSTAPPAAKRTPRAAKRQKRKPQRRKL